MSYYFYILYIKEICYTQTLIDCRLDLYDDIYTYNNIKLQATTYQDLII